MTCHYNGISEKKTFVAFSPSPLWNKVSQPLILRLLNDLKAVSLMWNIDFIESFMDKPSSKSYFPLFPGTIRVHISFSNQRNPDCRVYFIILISLHQCVDWEFSGSLLRTVQGLSLRGYLLVMSAQAAMTKCCVTQKLTFTFSHRWRQASLRSTHQLIWFLVRALFLACWCLPFCCVFTLQLSMYP